MKFRKINWKHDFGQGPEKDWKAILLVSLALTIVSIAFNIWTYSQIGSEEGLAPENGRDVGEVINLDEVKAAAAYYQSKAQNFSQILKSGTSTASTDPSL